MQFSQALRELAHINAYQISNAKLFLITKALNWVSHVLRAVRDAGRKIGSLVMRAEKAMFGEEFVLLEYYTKYTTGFKESAAGVRTASVLSVLKAKLLPVGRVLMRIVFLARGYRKLIKWLQKQVKGLLKDTQHDLWPWALALAGLRLQLGSLPLRRVPGYTLRLTAYPVVAVSKFMGLALLVGWRRVRRLCLRPVLAGVGLVSRNARALARAKARVGRGASGTIPAARTWSNTTFSTLADASADVASDVYTASFDAIASLLESSVSAVNNALDGVDSVVDSTTKADIKGETKIGHIL